MLLCLEETEQDLPGVEVREGGEVLAKGEEVLVGWEEHVPGLDPAGVVFVPIAEPKFPTKWEPPAITLVVPSAAQK